MKPNKLNSLEERFFLSASALIKPGEKILVAFSGGADSVALLYLLSELSERLNIKVMAAHLNHGIRGKEADRDEVFCADICKKIGIELTVGHADIPAEASKSGEGTEECARRIRYAFLNDCAAKLGCDKIATAHHADDNIETVLLHLVRGCGLNGISGIAKKRGNIIRPLLDFRKSEITEYLSENGIDFVFDSTNSDLKMTRNKIRHTLTSTLYEINPRADRAFSNMCKSAEQDNEYLISLARKIDRDAPLSSLKELPKPILLRFIQLRYAEKFEGSVCPQLSYIHLSQITDFIENGIGNADFTLPGGRVAHLSSRGLEISDLKPLEDAFSFQLAEGENIFSQNGFKILITRDKNVANKWKNIYRLSISASVSSDKIFNGDNLDNVYVRSLKTGDSYVFGGHKRNVRRRLIDIKVPAYRRKRLPVFCRGEELFWVPGLSVSDAFKAKGDEVYIVYTEIIDEAVEK